MKRPTKLLFKTAFKLIDQELKEQDTSSVFTLASNVLQSGIDKSHSSNQTKNL